MTFSRTCEKTAQTQVALDQCAYTELQEVQRQLAPVLLKEEKSASRRLVLAAQASFASYEKAECAARSYVNTGGSIYPMAFTGCETQLTVQRIESILEYLSQFP